MWTDGERGSGPYSGHSGVPTETLSTKMREVSGETGVGKPRDTKQVFLERGEFVGGTSTTNMRRE